jgi:hypothetical protein
MKNVIVAITSTALCFMLLYVWCLHSGYLFQRREVEAIIAASGQQDYASALAQWERPGR